MGGACFRRLGQENLLIGTHTFDEDNADEPCDGKQRMHSGQSTDPNDVCKNSRRRYRSRSDQSDEIIAAY